MADEKLTLELQLKGYAEAISRLGSVGDAVGALGTGNLGGIGAGVAAAGRLGAFNTALGVAVAAIGGLALATKSAADALHSFGRLRDTLGSSTGEAAILRVFGSALGISDMGGLADRVNTALGSGHGAAMAAEIGIGREQDIGPNAVNRGENLIRVMQHIRAATDAEEALSRARRAGAVELVEIFHMERDEYQKRIKDAKELAATMTPGRIRQAREFNYELDRLGRSFENLKIRALTPVIAGLNEFLEHPFFNFFAGIGGAAGRGIGGAIGNRLSPEKKGETALDENTAQMKKLEEVLRQTNGIWGGGGRARSAIPKAFGPGAGPYVAKQMRAGAIRLGAYSVSM